jgi:hypothetical protein
VRFVAVSLSYYFSAKQIGDIMLFCTATVLTTWLTRQRRMIVVMMDANYISERLSTLKNEMSDLRVTNALYCNRKGYTALQKSASALRHDRLVQIKLELADLMKRCA